MHFEIQEDADDKGLFENITPDSIFTKKEEEKVEVAKLK